jgi:ribosomal protein L39E
MDRIGSTTHPYARNKWGLNGFGLCFCIFGTLIFLIQPSASNASVADTGSALTLSANDGQKKVPPKTNDATKPEWTELTTSQKLALHPLRENWRYLGDVSKRKWIALSVNFNSMAPAEQLKLHARMNEWVALSQQERMQARLNFAQSKQLPQSHKSATWEAYQALSQEEKAKLARLEKDKKAVPPIALKNNQKPKLSTAPVKILASKPSPALASVNLLLDRHTLLLRAQQLEELPSKH